MKKLTLLFPLLLTSLLLTNMQNTLAQTKLPCLTMDSQVEVDQCITLKYTDMYQQMDGFYHKLIRQMEDTVYQDVLRASQQSWRVFVTNDCECEAYIHRDGSMANAMLYKCLIAATEKRIASLTLLLQNSELEK